MSEIIETLKSRPTCIIVVGMAGSGKTTVMQRMAADLRAAGKKAYIVNLDPAATFVPYPVNIDIRDSIKYKDVMSELQLGPNGGIMACLNLFATRMHQMLAILESKAEDGADYILVDTPGQIEAFTWSASGSIITRALASSFPTQLLYVADAERAARPVTFASTLLYATSVAVRAQLPMTLLFNKADIVRPSYAGEWISDVFALRQALDSDAESSGLGGGPGASYISTFSGSMALALCDFWEGLQPVEYSAVLGMGTNELMADFERCREEYFSGELCAELVESQRLKAEQRVAEAAEGIKTLSEDVKE